MYWPIAGNIKESLKTLVQAFESAQYRQIALGHIGALNGPLLVS